MGDDERIELSESIYGDASTQFSGYSLLALPVRISAVDHEQSNERALAFAEAVHQLAAEHEGVELLSRESDIEAGMACHALGLSLASHRGEESRLRAKRAAMQ